MITKRQQRFKIQTQVCLILCSFIPLFLDSHFTGTVTVFWNLIFQNWPGNSVLSIKSVLSFPVFLYWKYTTSNLNSKAVVCLFIFLCHCPTNEPAFELKIEACMSLKAITVGIYITFSPLSWPAALDLLSITCLSLRAFQNHPLNDFQPCSIQTTWSIKAKVTILQVKYDGVTLCTESLLIVPSFRYE